MLINWDLAGQTISECTTFVAALTLISFLLIPSTWDAQEFLPPFLAPIVLRAKEKLHVLGVCSLKQPPAHQVTVAMVVSHACSDSIIGEHFFDVFFFFFVWESEFRFRFLLTDQQQCSSWLRLCRHRVENSADQLWLSTDLFGILFFFWRDDVSQLDTSQKLGGDRCIVYLKTEKESGGIYVQEESHTHVLRWR